MIKADVNSRRPDDPFVPSRLVRNPMLQSTLATRKWDGAANIDWSDMPVLLDAGPDETGMDGERSVRLLGYYASRRTALPSKGMVLLMHGWNGCSHSTYNLIATRELIEAGYDVFRLNMRDHGPGIHVHPQGLNRGVFLGTLLNEAITAARRVAEMAGDAPFYLVGTSMGGNFALRMAAQHTREPIPNLRKVVAVNPAINPMRSTQLIDESEFLRRYFRRLWLDSLLAKERLFPETFSFEPLTKMRYLMDMTEWLVRHYSPYRDAEDYFGRYAAFGWVTAEISVSTHIIAARDDMVVPVADIYALAPNSKVKVEIHPYGGHVGYVDVGPFRRVGGTLVRQALEAD